MLTYGRGAPIKIRMGFETVDLKALCERILERNLDLEHASYFVSKMSIVPTAAKGMALWRKKLFVALARNAATPIEHFDLPRSRTAMTNSEVAM